MLQLMLSIDNTKVNNFDIEGASAFFKVEILFVWLISFHNLLGQWKKHHQKQPTEVFFEEGALKDFSKFKGKYLCQSLFFNKKRDSDTVVFLWILRKC